MLPQISEVTCVCDTSSGRDSTHLGLWQMCSCEAGGTPSKVPDSLWDVTLASAVTG